jgi:hypothetical protein
MQTFQRSVLIIALLLLIVTLSIMGIALKKNAGKSTAVAASCPDFWFSSYYEPCSMSKYGCCDDGVTPSNEDGKNCEKIVSCTNTPHGCCPDGYTTKTNKTGANCPTPGEPMCYNVKSLPSAPVNGDCRIKNPKSFISESGKSLLCNKQNWAKGCKVTWDGVTNLNNDCT